MTKLTRARLAGALALLLVGVALAIVLTRGDQPYDRSFDTRVDSPVYRGHGPVVLYDEGHLNPHTTTGAYKPLADLLRNDGYVLRIWRGPLTPAALAGTTVLILALPQGANDTNDLPAYTAEEIATIGSWVEAGGSLLLITDHWPFGSAAATLALRFGVEMGTGLVQDPIHHDPVRGDSHLVFSDENGLLRDHAVVRGRNPAERVRRVLTFTGQSLRGPAEAVAFLALSDSATELPPGPAKVRKDGGDVRVDMQYGEPVSVRGRAQGLALEVGKGRMVVTGEAGMFRAQRDRHGVRIGMNVPGYDNRQLSINIMHWLSRAL